VHADGDVYEG
jgi:hypothetical protein